MSRIKVLHLTKYNSPFNGGIENFLRDILQCNAIKKDCETRVIAHHHQRGAPTSHSTVDGVPVTRVKLWRQVLYAPICLNLPAEMKRILKDFKPDVLHIHMPNLSAFICLFSRDARRCRWILHWHSDVLGGAPDWRVKLLYPVYRLFEKWLLSKAHTIVCTSPNYLDTSQPLAQVRDKCVVIPLGISFERINPVPPVHVSNATQTSDLSLNQPNNQLNNSQQLNLLCVGRLTYYKGHAVLLDAIAELTHVHLDIVGEGEERAALESKIASLGLSSRVTLHGQVSDSTLTTHMMNTDLLCLPSVERTEAFGLVILEAARCKKPALVTDVKGSGMSWVVQDGKTGWVVPASNYAAMRESLKEIQRNKPMISFLGQAAHERLITHFQAEAVSDQIVAMYRQAVS